MEFEAGQQVEVKMKEECFQGSYYEATIISKQGSFLYKVGFNTFPVQDVLNVNQLRPLPPQIPTANLDFDDWIDAYKDDGWWTGIITGKSKSECLVYFPSTGKEEPFPLEKLRMHHKWSNGEWISSKMANERQIMEFQTGVEVEVKGVEEGFQGSFYAAKIISKEGSSQYKVKFNTLLKEDLTDFLEEVVDANQLRPVPPQVPKKYFTLYEFVDAYDNDGWWAGIICGKFRSDYFIYFPTTDEEKPYPFEKLRVHQRWLNGEWIFP